MFLKSSESLSYDRSETAATFFMRFLHTSSCDVSSAAGALQDKRKKLDYKIPTVFQASNGKENNVNKCSNHLFISFLCKHREQTPCPVACLLREERCLLRGRFITRRSLFRYVPWL